MINDLFYDKLKDTHIDVPSVETQKLVGDEKQKTENSKQIQKRVQDARNIQTRRFKGTNLSAQAGIKSNAEMGTREVKIFCPLSTECRTMMMSATASMNLTARSYFKVVKVARTIADLASEKEITVNHLAEALQYRPKENDL